MITITIIKCVRNMKRQWTILYLDVRYSRLALSRNEK